MITLETKEQITNHVRRLQSRYKELKLKHRKYNEEYWKIFDSTVQLLDGEIFKWVLGYERLYLISNHGRVYSKKSEQLLTHKINRKTKYHQVGLYKNNYRKYLYVHRLVLEKFSNEVFENKETRHLDGDKSNNHIDNLCYGTHIENQADRILHGTDNKGSKHGNSILTEIQVKEIREKYKSGACTHDYLAEEYGVSRVTITLIINYKLWKHI